MGYLELLYVIIISLLGLLGIILPRIPGLSLIWAGAAVYGLATGFDQLTWQLLLTLAGIAAGARFGSNYLSRIYNARFGKQGFYLLNTIVGSIATLLLFGVLLGPLFGLLGWEFLVRRRIADPLPLKFNLFLIMARSTCLEYAAAIVMIVLWLRCLV